MTTSWDPESKDLDGQIPSRRCLQRVHRDLAALDNDPIEGIHLVSEESDSTKIHALVIGPEGTPYQHGFFHFLLRLPPNYPLMPPRVKLMTTGGGKVSFSPIFFSNGKVCLMLLGTHASLGWTPALRISNVLSAIRSVMLENLYTSLSCSPGYIVERNRSLLQNETLRVAVCDTLEECLSKKSKLPRPLQKLVRKEFGNHYDWYVNCVSGQLEEMGDYEAGSEVLKAEGIYKKLLSRLNDIHNRLKELEGEEEEEEGK